MSRSHYQKTLSELIRSRGRPISNSPVSEGASSGSPSGSSRSSPNNEPLMEEAESEQSHFPLHFPETTTDLRTNAECS